MASNRKQKIELIAGLLNGSVNPSIVKDVHRVGWLRLSNGDYKDESGKILTPKQFEEWKQGTELPAIYIVPDNGRQEVKQ